MVVPVSVELLLDIAGTPEVEDTSLKEALSLTLGLPAEALHGPLQDCFMNYGAEQLVDFPEALQLGTAEKGFLDWSRRTSLGPAAGSPGSFHDFFPTVEQVSTNPDGCFGMQNPGGRSIPLHSLGIRLLTTPHEGTSQRLANILTPPKRHGKPPLRSRHRATGPGPATCAQKKDSEQMVGQ